MEHDKVRETVIDVFITSAEAQLRALRRLKKETRAEVSPKKRRSILNLIEDILQRSETPLHVKVIIEQVRLLHAVTLDRESIVSALTKKVHRKNRFCRTAPNTFGLIGRHQ